MIRTHAPQAGSESNEAVESSAPEGLPVVKKKRGLFRRILRFLRSAFFIGLLFVIGWTGAFYYYRQYRLAVANPEAISAEQTEKIISKVGRLMILPSDETPTLAIISDKSQIGTQPFFKNVQNGDILIAYAKNAEAILYRPSSDKIVQVGPIVSQDQTTAATTAPTDTGESTPPTTVSQNGSTTVPAKSK